MSMDHYYVNKIAQQNGDHEVHKLGCIYMPIEVNRQYLGHFFNCQEAVNEARRFYSQSNGCYYCSKECHTS